MLSEDKIKCSVYQREYRKKYPWLTSFYGARRRCSDSQFKNYINLEFSMTKEDFKELWFRDKAYLLNRPSIDRKDNKIGYVKSNCRFMELAENIGRIIYNMKDGK